MRCTDAQRPNDARGRRGLLPRVLLSIGALLAAGAVAVGGSTLAANRSGGTSVRANAFAGGSVVLARSGHGAFLSFPDVAIGVTRTGRLTLENEGSRAGTLALSGRVRSNPFSRRLSLSISSGGQTIYRGSLAGFEAVAAGTIPAGGRRDFVFRVSLPTTGSSARDDALQGETVDASFSWSAVAA